MAYVNLLRDSPYYTHFPLQLHEHLAAEVLEDSHVEYQLPEIHDEPLKLKKKENFSPKPTDVRIPARINSPLIPYPAEIIDFVNGSYKGNTDYIHGHHSSQLIGLDKVVQSLKKNGSIPDAENRFGVNHLKPFAKCKYSQREDLINLATLSFAKRATTHDLGIAAGSAIPFDVSVNSISKYTSFIIMIQRLRIHIAKHATNTTFNGERPLQDCEEAQYQMFHEGVYVYHAKCKQYAYYLIACGGHFRLYHSDLGYWFCGPATYLDYIFSVADILNNLDVLKNCDEYTWARDIFKVMIRFAEYDGEHRWQVDFMKSIEGFFLNMSDYDENFAMNWKPILEAAHDLWILDRKITGSEYDLGLVLSLLHSQNYRSPRDSFLCDFIKEAMKLSRTHRQEISALHKLIFYSEVNSEAGVNKFLKRVHTPRKVDPHSVKNITRLAKQLFLIAYRKRHGTIPKTIGPHAKVKLLETYSQKNDFSKIELLPLSWWDELKIFDCMDNTLTDDPLEFAKDKGALKDRVSFGPGDSRKELLQVIEREKYDLTDFFSRRKIVPRHPLVRRTCQKVKPEYMRDPARLIEKEREQKYEARLFANGELSNKHSLSLVAARMKKALAYFDEQLMTPTDKKRKALIHEAARELSMPDNYSLLLDIEGHNQSMQHSNTSELSEFIGNLFGFDGWGDLPHYFGQLTVYHYDEYLDKVIESHGQLGGIEGWLNPLWTLHTLLMMKLMRIMTDIDVRTIMVYSDDVNAVLSIKQASEPMVQSIFSKVMNHCSKFGMTVKYSQTTLSKHRITMLRQHYADGIRADSTLKRLISVSAGNNPTIVADELEIAGICSSASSALELSNHHEACSYLKNYKIGLLLSRLPQMILSRINSDSMISPAELPVKLSNLLYYSKEDKPLLNPLKDPGLLIAAKNDIAAYLGRNPKQLNQKVLDSALKGMYGQSVAEARLADSPDRVLYLQIYDPFIIDLLFYWAYLPTSLGGLGASLHLNIMLSGHSIGMSKSLHYLHQWIVKFAVEKDYFYKYLSVSLSVDTTLTMNLDEKRLVTSTWPSDKTICAATTSVQQSIKSMVRWHTKNANVLKMFELSDDREKLAFQLVNIFRSNFHARIAQFYHENTSIHFIDLLISKIETSSGLLVKVRNITRLRNSLSSRMVENIRLGANTSRTIFSAISDKTDIIEFLLNRKIVMFPKVKMIEVEEVLYDDKISEVDTGEAMLTIRRCAPTHYRNGVRVYDDAKVGNETLYKGELLDDDRMLGNKEELLAAKLVAVTKWQLMKNNMLSADWEAVSSLDCVRACNMALSTLTRQTFQELFHYAPTETGGEILHRIPNIRFSTATYIRSEMNRSLNYTTDLNQGLITAMGLVDSNVNFDYVRMRFITSAVIRDKYDQTRRLVIRYGFTRLTGVKDVQFVVPICTDWTVKESFRCYSDIRDHNLSPMRFRYLSHSYLHVENLNEWALLPKITEAASAELLGWNYVNDLILRYSRDLDKDYMLLSRNYVDRHLWMPLITKLDKIDTEWRKSPDKEVLEEIRDRLEHVLTERSRLTTVDHTNAVHLALQTNCLERIADDTPNDSEYYNLVTRYSRIAQNRRHSGKLSMRLAQYQAMLSRFNEHKRCLAKSLIFEYVTTFHFKVRIHNQQVMVDGRSAFDELFNSGVSKFSFMLINPDLQVRLLVLGVEYIESLLIESGHELMLEYEEICSDLSVHDVLVPTTLPTIGSYTPLTGYEEIPDHLHEIAYSSQYLPLSCMSSLQALAPLAKYAHLCSTTGSSPYTFTSFTGSDSLGAQIGLFKMLSDRGILDASMNICDLTAGRGDGLYAISSLGLTCTSFARDDPFTRLHHHPGLVFKKDYDVFDGSTLKFITAFDFVHIDISFSGSDESNILDLILFLEENNLAYSIRMNSVKCINYSQETAGHLPSYRHELCYAVNKSLKPYQIYLLGTPSESSRQWTGPHLKDSMAFKSLALSYSYLLSPINYNARLEGFDYNSVSIYLPPEIDRATFISKICENSIQDEQLYYCQRYLAEIGDDTTIELSYNHLDKHGKSLLEARTRDFHVIEATSYLDLNIDKIGDVSKNSRRYHEAHINAMIARNTPIWVIDILRCDEQLLEYLRVHHPIQEVRSWCNICLGMLRFCRSSFLSGHAAIVDMELALRDKCPNKLSLHQREFNCAIKLLVLAARDDDYLYGVRYCHKLMAGRHLGMRGLARTLRMYKLMSFLFEEIQALLSNGMICIRSIQSISNELEVREKIKYKYKRIPDKPTPAPGDTEFLDKIIADSIDDLFSGLERYASNLVEEDLPNGTNAPYSAAFGDGPIIFDINIEEHVEMMVNRLNLQPSGPHGFIDLGDEDFPDNEDW